MHFAAFPSSYSVNDAPQNTSSYPLLRTTRILTVKIATRNLDQMLMGAGVWNFVVLVDGHPVALLELEKVLGKWQGNGAYTRTYASTVSASDRYWYNTAVTN